MANAARARDVAACPQAVWPHIARRCLAVFVAFAIVTASFAITARATAAALTKGPTTAEMTTAHKQMPTPCQKMLVTGAPSSCAVSSLNFNGIPVADAAGIAPDASSATRWPILNFSLPPQCSGLSPYRPPCASV